MPKKYFGQFDYMNDPFQGSFTVVAEGLCFQRLVDVRSEVQSPVTLLDLLLLSLKWFSLETRVNTG